MTLLGVPKNQVHAPSVPRSGCFPDTHTSNLLSCLSTHPSLPLSSVLISVTRTPTLSVLFPYLTLREALPLVAVRTEENKASWVPPRNRLFNCNLSHSTQKHSDFHVTQTHPQPGLPTPQFHAPLMPPSHSPPDRCT